MNILNFTKLHIPFLNMEELWFTMGIIYLSVEAYGPLTLVLKAQESLKWFMHLCIREKKISCLIVYPFTLGLEGL